MIALYRPTLWPKTNPPTRAQDRLIANEMYNLCFVDIIKCNAYDTK